MASNAQNSSVVAARYVGALLDLARDKKAVPAVEKDMIDLAAMLDASQDLQNMIRSPLIATEKQLSFIDAFAKKAKFHDLTANFLRVLAQNGRLNVLGAAVDAFKAELSTRRGEVLVSVQTAQDLSAKQLKSLQDTLKKHTGTDVKIDAKTDPAILGGMIVTVGSQMVDDSVRRKLDRLKFEMSGQDISATGSLKEAV